MDKTLKIDFDLYTLYDRLLDGVMVEVTLGYRLDDIVENGITKQNLFVDEIAFPKETHDYLTSNPFNIGTIRGDVFNFFDADDNAEEYLTENMPDTEYKLIEHHFNGDDEAIEFNPGNTGVEETVGKVISGANLGELLKNYHDQLDKKD